MLSITAGPVITADSRTCPLGKVNTSCPSVNTAFYCLFPCKFRSADVFINCHPDRTTGNRASRITLTRLLLVLIMVSILDFPHCFLLPVCRCYKICLRCITFVSVSYLCLLHTRGDISVGSKHCTRRLGLVKDSPVIQPSIEEYWISVNFDKHTFRTFSGNLIIYVNFL